jgi:ABC-type transport system involved in cytochrome c biogenesis permease subunit
MEHASVICLWIAFLLYAASFAVFVYHLFSRRATVYRLGLIVSAAGLGFHTVAIITRGVSAGHFPFLGAFESLVMLAWAISVVWHVLEVFTRIKAVGLYVMGVVVVLLTVAWGEYDAPAELVPALRSDIVVLHVVVMLTAIAALYVAGGAAIIYLIEQALLKRHRLNGVLGRLPSLASLEKLIYHATLFGLPFLTMGMVAGVIRAVTFRVADWWADPMVLLSLCAWGLYAWLLWGRARGDWAGERVAWLSVSGLVLMLVIRFAAVPYLSGFHTYGG